MNHLAHTFLSCSDSDLLAGNFMGDFIKNKEVAKLDEKTKRGIILHRKIDEFTDNHPEAVKASSLLHPTQGKYSPVLIDIFFDYFLTKHWNKYSLEPLETFTERTYKTLASKADSFPDSLKVIFPKMVADDFLMSCKNQERLTKTFLRLSKRTHFKNNIIHAWNDLEKFHKDFENHFLNFFPDLMAEVNRFCSLE